MWNNNVAPVHNLFLFGFNGNGIVGGRHYMKFCKEIDYKYKTHYIKIIIWEPNILNTATFQFRQI
jgi:hypothetical protein